MPMDGEVNWTGEIHEEGELRFRLGRRGERLIAEWPGLCTLQADRDGNRSELVPAPGADPVLIDKLHRGLAKALLRHLTGQLTLHASAVAFDGIAIACVGESHAGKSTAVAELVAHHDGALVADDTLALVFQEGHVGVLPTEQVSWLLPDARLALGLTDVDLPIKIPVSPPRIAENEVCLAALVILEFDDGIDAPVVRRLRGNEVLARLVPSVVRFVLDEPERNRRELDQLLRLVDAVPTYELARPRELEKLAATGHALRALARRMDGGRS